MVVLKTKYTELTETKMKLEKAKEIIKSILPYMPKENIEGIYEIVEQAEEFLKDN